MGDRRPHRILRDVCPLDGSVFRTGGLCRTHPLWEAQRESSALRRVQRPKRGPPDRFEVVNRYGSFFYGSLLGVFILGNPHQAGDGAPARSGA